MDAYKKLAMAVVEQACADYLLAVRTVKKLEIRRQQAKSEITSGMLAAKITEEEWKIKAIEDFFRSTSYTLYCDIDPEFLIQKLKKADGKKTRKTVKQYVKKKRV